MTDNSSTLDFVTIGEREYSRMIYSCGLMIYTVKTNQTTQHGRYVWREIKSVNRQRQIDKAIEVKSERS